MVAIYKILYIHLDSETDLEQFEVVVPLSETVCIRVISQPVWVLFHSFLSLVSLFLSPKVSV